MTAALADPSIDLDEGEQTIPEFSDMTTLPAPEPVAPKDPAAPYGRTRSGAVRAKPGPKKTTSSAPKKTTSAAPKKTAAPSSAPSSSSASTRPTPPADPDAEPGRRALALMKLAGAPVMALGFSGYGMTRAYAAGSPLHKQGRALLADAEALGSVLPDLCQGLDEVAQTKPNSGLARFLDRIAEASPYARLASAVTQLAAQMATNHGLVPAGMARVLGAVDPEQLADRGEDAMADTLEEMATR